MKEYNKIMFETLKSYFKVLQEDVYRNSADIKMALRDIAYVIKEWLGSLEDVE